MNSALCYILLIARAGTFKKFSTQLSGASFLVQPLWQALQYCLYRALCQKKTSCKRILLVPSTWRFFAYFSLKWFLNSSVTEFGKATKPISSSIQIIWNLYSFFFKSVFDIPIYEIPVLSSLFYFDCKTGD